MIMAENHVYARKYLALKSHSVASLGNEVGADNTSQRPLLTRHSELDPDVSEQFEVG